MKIIPVLDLLSGKVVQGVGGQRDIYQPLQNSVITSKTIPLEVIKDFNAKLDLEHYYIADLDSIQRTETCFLENNPNYEQIQAIVEDGSFKIMVDSGCQAIENITELNALGADNIIIGTETMATPLLLDQAVQACGAERIILSIDLSEGKLVANSNHVKEIVPMKLAKHAEKLGINAIIVLELKKVGSEAGPLNKQLIDIASQINNVPVYTGGGVRTIQDLELLADNNVEGALIATAFHKGTIKKEEIEQFYRNK